VQLPKTGDARRDWCEDAADAFAGRGSGTITKDSIGIGVLLIIAAVTVATRGASARAILLPVTV